MPGSSGLCMPLAGESNGLNKLPKSSAALVRGPSSTVTGPKYGHSGHSFSALQEISLDHNGRASPAHAPNGKLKGSTPDASFRTAQLPGEFLETKENRVSTLETRVSCSLGSTVAGILYKWVNFGKGWRPRWFELQDGVLSYYKVHGPDKIVVSREGQKGFRVIGDESQRFLNKPRNLNADDSRQQKASGELHLKVSSIRRSKADDKKFYIFTGTKTLHLRAETRDERSVWLDSLQAAKDLFPKCPLSNDLFSPPEEIAISTDKLRARLLKEDLSDEVVNDCEKIMLSEFMELQDQLKALQQNHFILIERVRQLEAEKLELETTVVDESQDHHTNEENDLRGHGHERDFEVTATESDEDNEKHDAAEAESDEDDDVFFDSKEALSATSFSRHTSIDSFDLDSDQGDTSDGGSPSENGADSSMEFIGMKYPRVRRRRRLPEPKEKEKGVSLWSLIKDNIGKDLTRVCLPVYFNEPISSLQKCFEDLEYSYLLDRANEWGKQGNSLMRLLNVAAFAVSSYSSTEDRNCKPFNPLLGETYEADFPDRGVRFFSEKVSHHPMIVACHCEGKGWKFWGDSTVKSKFWGRSIQLDPFGVLTLEFGDGEAFQWSKVTTSIYNLIIGKLYCDHYGTMRIQGSQELSCKLKFKEQSIIDRNPHQVQGFVHDKSGRKLASLFGKWDESMYFVNGDLASKPKGYDPMTEARLLWKRNKPAKCPTRYNLTSFAITLNELTSGLKEKLPPTDSRLRPDQRHLENGEYEQAFVEKLRLEQKQRMARKLQERGWQPRWFRKEKGKDTYQYIGGYWEARSQGNWDSCPDIFGPGLPELPQE